MLHPTAILEGNIRLPPDNSVSIGPYAVLRGTITLGKNTRIGPHACLEGRIEAGDDNTIGHGAIIGADPQDLSFNPATPSGVRIGSGNTIREYATIHRSSHADGFTTLGDRNFLMAGAHVGHDATIGNDNVVANNVLFAGHVTLGNNAFLGGGSVYHQFIRIGDRVMVQGNAGLSRSPALHRAHAINQIAGLNVIGLRRAGVPPPDATCSRKPTTSFTSTHLPLQDIAAAAASGEFTDEALQFLTFFTTPSRKGVCR